MKIFYDFIGVENIRNAVVTTGSFDGVHVGHRVIIDRINKLARESGGESVLITFHPHPRKVLYPESAGKDLMLINSQKEKVELLNETGLDNVVIVTFTKDFAQTSSTDFVRDILLKKLHSKIIVVGFNHHFGHNREGDFEKLADLGRQLDFYVEEIPEQEVEKEAVSSTKVRKALLEGNIQRANAYLDHQFLIIGDLMPGSNYLSGSGIKAYAITIEEECKLVPPGGIYAISLQTGNMKERGMAITRIDPASNGKHVDIILPDSGEDLSGKPVIARFHKMLAGKPDYDNPTELSAQIMTAHEILDELIF